MYSEGQRVVCVDDQFSPQILILGYKEFPVQGREYTVRKMLMGRDWIMAIDKAGHPMENPDKFRSAEPAVLVNELHNPDDPCCAGYELAFRATRFAPLEEADFGAVTEPEEVPVTTPLLPLPQLS